MKTHWKKNFDYRYTGAYELEPGETKTLTISKLTKEEICGTTGTKQKCTIATFADSSKPMVLNKTNCKTIESLYGPYMEDWIGKKVLVIVEKGVHAFGTTTDALRVKKSFPKETRDYTEQEHALKSCTSIDDLQKVYLSLNAGAKNHCIKIKDNLKSKLLGETK